MTKKNYNEPADPEFKKAIMEFLDSVLTKEQRAELVRELREGKEDEQKD